MHKEGYLTSDVIHVHEWNTTKEKKKKNPLYHYYYYQQATSEWTCTHLVMHYARDDTSTRYVTLVNTRHFRLTDM